MSERQDREYEKLKSLDDYLLLYRSLDDLASEVTNTNSIDESMVIVGKAIKRKVKYLVSFSKAYTRRQGFISLLKDRKEEKARLKQEQLDKAEEEMMSNLHEKFAKTDKGSTENISSLSAPPKAEELKPTQNVEVLEEPKELEVIEDNESSKLGLSSEDDEPMQF